MRVKNVAPKAAAAMMAAASAMSMVSPALAATKYTAVSGTSTSFKKFLIMSIGDNVPNVTFSYTIAAGDAVSPITINDNEVFQVLPGVDADKITIQDTTFAPSDATFAAAQTGDVDVTRKAEKRASGLNADTGVEFAAGAEKYAKKETTVDFSQVKFDEPGIYRYIITETASSTDEDKGIMHDNDVDRILDVYVVDNGSGTLVVSQYVMHTDLNADSVNRPVIGEDAGSVDVNTAGARLSDKTDGFTNEYKSKDLAFKKEVTGNQASRDKYFKFSLALTNLNANDKYTVSIADDGDENTNDGFADGTSGSNSATIAANTGKTNVLELTASGSGAVTQDFYLQHGQSIVVRGLPKNAKYSVTEEKEDYKSTAAAVENYTKPVTSGDSTIGAIAGNDKLVKTSYLNTRAGNIPTGVLASVLPGIVLAGVGGAGFAASRKRRSEDEE